MRFGKQSVGAIFAMLSVYGAGSAAQAGLINPSFETGNASGYTYVTSGGYRSELHIINNLAANNGGDIGDFNNYPDGEPMGMHTGALPGTANGIYYASFSGNSEAGVNNSYLYQDFGVLQANTDYTLTVAIGVGRFTGTAPGDISLINGTDNTGIVEATASIASLGMSDFANNFADLTTSFSTGASVSGDLTILITAIGGYPAQYALDIDNIRLSAVTAASPALPEPASMAISLMGGAGLLARKRRRTA